MKSPIGYKTILCLFFLLMMAIRSHAQFSQSNPDQYQIIGEQTGSLNKKINNQVETKGKTATLQAAISAEFTKIKSWEAKYIDYLKEARGYAESLKAGTSIFIEGIQTLQYIYELQKVMAVNPQGIAATLSLNDLYLEAATEFLKVFTTLKESVAKGTEKNMLNGSERAEMLWQLNDQIKALNRKLNELTISIAYHNMMDVWYKYTSGIISRDKRTIANASFERWRRASSTSTRLSQ